MVCLRCFLMHNLQCTSYPCHECSKSNAPCFPHTLSQSIDKNINKSINQDNNFDNKCINYKKKDTNVVRRKPHTKRSLYNRYPLRITDSSSVLLKGSVTESLGKHFSGSLGLIRWGIEGPDVKRKVGRPSTKQNLISKYL